MLGSVSTVGIAWPGNPARTLPACSSTTIRPSGSDSTAVGCENVATRLSVKPGGTVAADTGVDGPPKRDGDRYQGRDDGEDRDSAHASTVTRTVATQASG